MYITSRIMTIHIWRAIWRGNAAQCSSLYLSMHVTIDHAIWPTLKRHITCNPTPLVLYDMGGK